MIEDVTAFLAADAGVIALTGDRVRTGILHESDQQLDSIAINTASREGDHHNGGPGLEINRVRIDCYSSTWLGAKTIARAVRTALDGHSGAMGGYADVLYASLTNEVDLFDNATARFRTSLTFRLRGQTMT